LIDLGFIPSLLR